MINIVPIIGWIISFVISFLLAIPFHFLWNYLAPIYLGPLIDIKYHDIYCSIPFFNVVFIFMMISMISGILRTGSITTKK